jgi:hypothetical protein
VGLNNPLDSQGELEPWAKYKWWILGVLGLALAAGAGVMLKANPAAGVVGGGMTVVTGSAATGDGGVGSPVAAGNGPGALLLALKEELFALETDRLEGTLSTAEYTAQKAALETVLKRALARPTGRGPA